jgi:GNAT superfamily N-acetyltransferase
MDTVAVRRATLDDAPALALLRWRFKQEDADGPVQPQHAFTARCEKWLREALAGDWLAWVADAPEGICGHVFCCRVDKVPGPDRPDSDIGYVTNFYVTPRWRGRGVGRALLAALDQHTRELRMDTLIVWPSDRSVPLYRRVGYRAPDELLELPIEPS